MTLKSKTYFLNFVRGILSSTTPAFNSLFNFIKSNIELLVAAYANFSLKTLIIGILSVLYDLSHSLFAKGAYREIFLFANCQSVQNPGSHIYMNMEIIGTVPTIRTYFLFIRYILLELEIYNGSIDE
jgi:hypothetical protein